MKKLSLFLSSLLSLGFSDAVKADYFAEEPYNSSLPIYDNFEPYYQAKLRLSGFYGNNGGSYSEADLLIPVVQSPYTLGYLDIRGQKRESNLWQGSVGGGYRFLSPDMKAMYGLYAFYNAHNSPFNNTYAQLITGLEFKTEWLSFGANYYNSIGTTQNDEDTANTYTWQLVSGINNNLLINNAIEQQKVQGGDGELGLKVPFVDSLHVYGGYYYFEPTDYVSTIHGPRFRLSYRLDEALSLPTLPLSLESSWQQDTVNGTLWTVGLRLTVPFGNSSDKTSMQPKMYQAMTDYVQFGPIPEPTISYNNQTPYTIDGNVATFARVNSLSDLDTALTGNSDVIVVNQDITLDTTKQLPNNIQVTGQNFEYAPGQSFNLTGNAVPSEITGATGESLFSVGENTQIQDLTLNTPSAGTANVYALVNLGEGSVGNLTVQNISSNAPIILEVRDGSSTSIINMLNNTLTLEKGAAIQIININSPMTINTVSNNKISFVDNTENDRIGIRIMNGEATQTIGAIDDNEITGLANTSNFGIYLANNLAGTGAIQTVSSISNNQISGGTVENSLGIILLNSFYVDVATGGTQTITNITGNTIAFSDGNGNTGIELANTTGNQTLTGAINQNEVTLGNTSASTATGKNVGIKLKNNPTLRDPVLDNVQNIAAVDSNKVTITEAGNTDNFAGILIENDSGSVQTVSSLQNNAIVLNNNVNTAGAINTLFGIQAINHSAQTINNIIDNSIGYNGVQSGNFTVAVISLNATYDDNNQSVANTDINNFYNNNFTATPFNSPVIELKVGDTTEALNSITIIIGAQTYPSTTGTGALEAANNDIYTQIDPTGASNIVITD
jgi:hypothetical protein